MSTTTDPLVPRPAATVMLVRDAAESIEVFMMRRHAAMEFVAGVMVFPGGGVDDRDRNADIAWFGPEPDWWAQRLGVDTRLAEALGCGAGRETFQVFGGAEKLAAGATVRRPGEHGAPPNGDPPRRYDTFFFVGALPEGQRADGEN